MAVEWADFAVSNFPVYYIDTSETIQQSYLSLVVILTTFSGIVLARVLVHRICNRSKITRSYLVEFVLIVVPGILFVTVASNYSIHFVGVMVILSLLYILCTHSLTRARSRVNFDLGTRPYAITIVRALTHLITAICILAIDFKIFHRPYRKSIFFGAQLMDTGIGLFVFNMGLVSRRSRNFSDIRRSALRSALPLILLGFARLIAIIAINYGQDEHEYGQHLNAFFTLGLTKLFGSLVSCFVRNDAQLLLLALGIGVCHQIGLTYGGISDFVMDYNVPRSTILKANREGIFCLPGFVAIYLTSISFSRWLVGKTLLTYQEITRKLFGLFFISLSCWGFTVASAYLIGISRVTCNLGYIFWIFSITTIMLFLCTLLFDFIISNNLTPYELLTETDKLEEGSLSTKEVVENSDRRGLFLICESLNMNGLVFFLLANILTGCVNMFLNPNSQSDSASLIILLIYMLLVTYVVHVLYKKRISIA